MSFARVAAVFVSLLAVAALFVPVSRTGALVKSGTERLALPTLRCLSLEFEDDGFARSFPRAVRLSDSISRTSETIWRLAQVIGTAKDARYEWRPIEADSIEIAGYHTPRVRLSHGGAGNGHVLEVEPVTLSYYLILQLRGSRRTGVAGKDLACHNPP